MGKKPPSDDDVLLTSEDIARFHRGARGALARRSGAAIGQSVAGSLELAVMGAVPMVGMLCYGWSAAQQLVFLVASLWIGIFCDLARLALVRRSVAAYVEEHYDDWHVWVVVAALRAGRMTAPRSHVQAKHQAGAGVFVDLAAGGFSTALIAAAVLLDRGADPREAVFDEALAWSLAGMAAYQAVCTAWEIVRVRRAGVAARAVQAQPGVRGLALFMLMFVTMTLGDPDGAGGLATGRVMLAVNGVIVAVGVLNAAAWLWLGSETRWLARYVREHRADIEAALAERTTPRTKKAKRRRG